MNIQVTSYRLALDRVRDASRALATHIDSSERDGTDFADDDRFLEIWSSYKRVLGECRAAFEHVPPQHRHRVPRPPSA